MFRLLIMCLLGLSGGLFEKLGVRASPMDMPATKMMAMENDVEEMTAKTKRHDYHTGSPCPLPYAHSAPAHPISYQKPIEIPSYQHIGYQKPLVPKMIYQTIQKPAIHHAAYNLQPISKPQIHYVQQPSYAPIVKEHPISYVKQVAPTVSYEHVQKLFTSYVKPVQHVHPIKTIQPVKAYVKQIPCDDTSTVLHKPVHEVQSYYPKQTIQPISYYSKPSHPSTDIIYLKPKPADHQPIVKLPVAAPHPDCEKPHHPQISYVKLPQPILQHVHQPMYQYAPKYHQPIVHYQAAAHFGQSIHHPPPQKTLVQYQHPVAYGAPTFDHTKHQQSHVISVNQPCH